MVGYGCTGGGQLPSGNGFVQNVTGAAAIEYPHDPPGCKVAGGAQVAGVDAGGGLPVHVAVFGFHTSPGASHMMIGASMFPLPSHCQTPGIDDDPVGVPLTSVKPTLHEIGGCGITHKLPR
jgi:hypothetical protein